MEFFNRFLKSSFGWGHWASHCDVQGIPVPSPLLCCPYSTLHTLSPKSADPSIASVTRDTLAASGATCDPSTSSTTYSRSPMADTQDASVRGLCSQPLSKYAHSPNCISGSTSHGNVAGRLLSIRGNDISLPIPNARSTNLLYGSLFAFLPYCKVRTFIQTKGTAINCGVSTYS
jgi:hypothetical protein